MYRFLVQPSRASTLPYSRGGRVQPRAVVPIKVIGPVRGLTVPVVLDTGADCCLFAEWVAWRAGLRRTPAAPVLTMGSSLGATGCRAWFGQIELQINDP